MCTCATQVTIAGQVYDYIDKHIQHLDEDLKQLTAELDTEKQQQAAGALPPRNRGGVAGPSAANGSKALLTSRGTRRSQAAAAAALPTEGGPGAGPPKGKGARVLGGRVRGRGPGSGLQMEPAPAGVEGMPPVVMGECTHTHTHTQTDTHSQTWACPLVVSYSNAVASALALQLGAGVYSVCTYLSVCMCVCVCVCVLMCAQFKSRVSTSRCTVSVSAPPTGRWWRVTTRSARTSGFTTSAWGCTSHRRQIPSGSVPSALARGNDNPCAC